MFIKYFSNALAKIIILSYCTIEFANYFFGWSVFFCYVVGYRCCLTQKTKYLLSCLYIIKIFIYLCGYNKIRFMSDRNLSV